MKNIFKIGVLAFLMGGLLGAECFAQVRAPANTPAAAPVNGGGYGGYGMGYGGRGYGGYGMGYGGYGGFGFGNPYNPYSPYSPYNPYSPYSPYNPVSPVSPYYNPYTAPYYAAAYAYNPIYNPGLLSRNPAIQLQAWYGANLATTNVYSYSNYYTSALQNQQAMINNYNSAVYQQAAMTQYVQSATLSTQAAWMLMQAQQYKDSITNPPYNPPQRSQQPSNPAPSPAPSTKYSSGFTGSTSSSYDPLFSAGVSSSYGMENRLKEGFAVRSYAPTFNQEQIKVVSDRLERVQKVSSAGEIISGFAQNTLLDDIRRYVGKEASMPPIILDEQTLRELNVIKNGGNLGAIRNDGKITWPVALGYVVPAADQRKFEETIITAIESAMKSKLDGNALISMLKQIDEMRSKLGKKIQVIETNDYLESKRFLNDLDDARFALKSNEWVNHMEYQKFIHRGKSVQELAKFMVEKGLKFAPATGQDEGSYKALYSALVAYDLQLNGQFGSYLAAKE